MDSARSTTQPQWRTCPHHHADPFDRVLVVQAQIDDYVLITRDPASHQYEVAWVWDGPVHDRVR